MFTEGQQCGRCEGGAYLNAIVHQCFPSHSQSTAYATALWAHRFLLKLEDKVTLFIAPSNFTRDRLLDWGIPPAKTEMIRNFTALGDFCRERGSFGMYLGRLSGEKGLDILLRALSAAGDPPFLIVGDGPLENALSNLVSELRLRRTELMGRLKPDQVAALIRRARFMTFSSLWDENAPLAALEAMAAGRPLLVTKRGGLPELVERGEGLMCAADDVDDMAAKIRRFMENDKLCSEAGLRARARAEAELGPDLHRDRLESAYERAVALGPAS